MPFPKHMMVVEDEVITQRYLRDILKQYNVETIECYDNGEDAYKAVKNSSCEMILMDINIKGNIDGIQLARKILQLHAIPVIFITAHSDHETFQEVLDLSPYGFIAKPFSAKDIETVVQVAYKRFLSQGSDGKAKTKKEQSEILVINEHYSYDKSLKKLYRDQEEVKLNGKQKRLVDILCKNLDRTVEYEVLRAEIWEDNSVAESALRTLIYSLRKQLPDLPIVSYSKVGYAIQHK